MFLHEPLTGRVAVIVRQVSQEMRGQARAVYPSRRTSSENPIDGFLKQGTVRLFSLVETEATKLSKSKTTQSCSRNELQRSRRSLSGDASFLDGVSTTCCLVGRVQPPMRSANSHRSFVFFPTRNIRRDVMYCVAGDTQGNDANTHSSIASHSRKMFGAHRMLLGVGRHLTDEGTGEVGHVDGMMNEGEVPDASALTAAPAPEERNATERITSVPVPEELPASASSVANLSGEATSPQPSAVSPDVDSESVSVEEATASLPEVPSSVGDTFGEATSPQPSAVSPDVDSESVSIEEATASLPEVSSAVNETVAEAPLPTPRALPITL